MDAWIVAGLGAGGIAGSLGTFMMMRWRYRMTLADAQVERGRILQEAEQGRESVVKTAEVAARELVLKARLEADEDSRTRRKEIQEVERRVQGREENVERRSETLERKLDELDRRERDLEKQRAKTHLVEAEVVALNREAVEKLQAIAGLSSEEAKRRVIQDIVEESKLEAARQIKRVEEQAREEAEQRSKKIIGLAIQRYAGEYITERTITTVNLPTDEMKGRIIGREGRNIRALEAATGVDLIIDDTPEAVVISSFNPVRREIARRSLDKLIADGRIHPARIEEIVDKSRREVEQSIKEAGEQAMFDLKLHGLDPEIVKLIGRLKYRTSYTQNQWAHSIETAFVCGIMAGEIGIDVKKARRAALLHDIGKAVSHEVEGGHAVIGADLAKRYGEADDIVHAIRAHHEDEKPATVLALLVQASDCISGARPGARRESMENYVHRLDELERISNSFEGVEKSFAIQAGREVRVIVENSRVSDEGAVMLSRDIARKIETELTYPGQVRVTVIRETRAVEVAK